MSRFLENELRRVLGEPALQVSSVHPVSGGCIHQTARVSTSRGELFAKWNDECPPDLFVSEAMGLRELRSAGSELVIPEVLAAEPPGPDHPAFIVMEYLPPADRPGDETALGSGLATVHRRAAETFGFQTTTYCGPTPQDNRPRSSWVELYAVQRIQSLAGRLEEGDRIGSSERKQLDRLADRLSSLLDHDPKPSLIHGDLWSGNALFTARGPALVDPACAYADREMEFGITTLFGGFGGRFFSAYEEAWPLPRGWRERNPVYQLYHLLNHHLIFGGHYGTQAMGLVRRYV